MPSPKKGVYAPSWLGKSPRHQPGIADCVPMSNGTPSSLPYKLPMQTMPTVAKSNALIVATTSRPLLSPSREVVHHRTVTSRNARGPDFAQNHLVNVRNYARTVEKSTLDAWRDSPAGRKLARPNTKGRAPSSSRTASKGSRAAGRALALGTPHRDRRERRPPSMSTSQPPCKRSPSATPPDGTPPTSQRQRSVQTIIDGVASTALRGKWQPSAHYAASKMQAHFHALRERRRRAAAATKVQEHYRGVRERKANAAARAATKVQAICRGARERGESSEVNRRRKHQKASKLQSLYRGHTERVSGECIARRRHLQRRTMAAATIEAVYRRRFARRLASACNVQAVCRGGVERSRGESVVRSAARRKLRRRQAASAVRIQSIARGRKGRAKVQGTRQLLDRLATLPVKAVEMCERASLNHRAMSHLFSSSGIVRVLNPFNLPCLDWNVDSGHVDSRRLSMHTLQVHQVGCG